MIGKLVFKLPEEKSEFQLAQKASALCAFIEEFSNHLTRRYKHEDPLNKQAFAEYEQIKKEFYEMLEEHEIDQLMWR